MEILSWASRRPICSGSFSTKTRLQGVAGIVFEGLFELRADSLRAHIARRRLKRQIVRNIAGLVIGHDVVPLELIVNIEISR